MTHKPCAPRGVLRRLAPPLTAVSVALLAGACAHQDAGLIETSSVASRERADAGHSASPLSKVSLDDPAALLAEARKLRKAGDRKGAYTLLEQASALHPGDRGLMTERGLLAVELGDVAKGKELLSAAIGAGAPDWRLHSALGAALSASGQQQEAQAQFAKALELAPDHPAVLNNLALSYALDGKQEEAERLLRRVAEQGPPAGAAQAKQNLALILGLSGRTDEAKSVTETAVPGPQAKANMDYLEKLAETAQAAPAADAAPVRAAHAGGLPAPTYRLGRLGSKDPAP
jgi:Flp pilus assembly protein TadD